MNSGVLTFFEPSDNMKLPEGDVKIADAFKPGAFPNNVTADAVLTGKNGLGKDVKAVVRLEAPVYENGVLTVKATPVAKGEAALLEGGEVAKAKASEGVEDLPKDAAFSLKDASIVIDSAEVEDAAASDGEKHGIVGGIIGA